MEGRIFYDDVENFDEDSILRGHYLSGPADAPYPISVSGLPAIFSSPAFSADFVFILSSNFSPEVLFGSAVCRLSFHSSLHPPKPSCLILLFTILDQILVEEA